MKTSRRRCKRPNITKLMPAIAKCSMSYSSINSSVLASGKCSSGMTTVSLAQTIYSSSAPAILNSNSWVVPTISQTAGTEIISGKLYLTSIDEAENLSFLKSKNITAILTINCDPVKVPTELEKENGGLKTLFIELGDNCTSQIKNYFDVMIDFIDSNECVLVHCHAGISRSATAVIAYMMKTRKMTLDQAERFVRSKRSIICPNFSFMGQLKSYENELMVLNKKIIDKEEEEEELIIVNDEEDQYKQPEEDKSSQHVLTKGKSLCENNTDNFKNTYRRTVSSPPGILDLRLDDDSGVDTSESGSESPLGSPKNKVQRVAFSL